MLQVSERIARLEGAKALVTGESLGQVASQTLENIAAVNEAVTMPVLRPAHRLGQAGDHRACP